MTWNSEPSYENTRGSSNSQSQKIANAIGVLNESISDDTAFLWTGGKEANVIADMLLYGVGEKGVTPVPFVIIDTGNHYDEMYDFRRKFVSPGDEGANTVGPFEGVHDVIKLRYDELLDGVILDENDPRSYHGEWDDSVDLPEEVKIDGLPRNKEGWGVPESCGSLKTEPIKELVREKGYDTLITGVRSEDPLSEDVSGHKYTTRNPVKHTRVAPLYEWSIYNTYAYIKKESISLPKLYTEEGYMHTDSKCCTDDEQVSEHDATGRDVDKMQAKQKLQDMGYI